jgi:hypothetical protein
MMFKRITTDLKDLAAGFFSYVQDGSIAANTVEYVVDYVQKNWDMNLQRDLDSDGRVAITVQVPKEKFPAMKEHVVPVTVFDGKKHILMYELSDFNIVHRGNRYWKSVTLPGYIQQPYNTYEVTVVLVKDERVDGGLKMISMYPGRQAYPEPDNIMKWQGLSPPPDLETSLHFWLSPEDIENKRTVFDNEKWALIYDEDRPSHTDTSTYAANQASALADKYIKIKNTVERDLGAMLPSNRFKIVSDEKSLFSIINKLNRDLENENEPLVFDHLKVKKLYEVIGDVIRFTVEIKDITNYKEELKLVEKACDRLAKKLKGRVDFKLMMASSNANYGSLRIKDPDKIIIEHAKILTEEGIKLEIQIWPSQYKSYKKESDKTYYEDKKRQLAGLPRSKDLSGYMASARKLTMTKMLKKQDRKQILDSESSSNINNMIVNGSKYSVDELLLKCANFLAASIANMPSLLGS